MVATNRLVFGGVFAVLILIMVWRLSGTLRVLITLWRRPQTTETAFAPGETIAVEGEVFVDESAIATDRIFETTPRDIGLYVWRAAFSSAGSYTYDSERGELQTARSSFASGLETGRFGVSIGNRDVYVDPSWLCRAYDSEPLSEITIGESNVSLPLGLSQRLFDAPYHDLTTVGECPSGALSDILDVKIHDDRTDEFVVEGRGVPSGAQLFVSGTVRIENGRPTIVGTEDSPLLIADSGRGGLRGQLLGAILKKSVRLGLVIGLGVLLLG